MQNQDMAVGRLLVVDDEIELMNLLTVALSANGYETTGFTSAAKALEALKQQDFDLLLTDLNMPGMDGIALLKAVLEVNPNILVIVMTGQATVETAVEAMKCGAFDYIAKPFLPDQLVLALSRAMKVSRLRLENIQLREAMAIYDLARAVSFPLDINVILDKVAEAALYQCNADEVSIMLPTHDGQGLYVAATKGDHLEHFLGARVALEEGIAGWVARNRQTVMLYGKADDSRFKEVNPRPDVQAALSMPMTTGDHFVGVININATRKRRSFTLGQVRALNILVSILAPLLQGSRLHAEASKAEEKYRSIFERAIEGIFQTTTDGKYLSANPALVRMYGYESEDELLQGVTDIAQQQYVNPEDRTKLRQLYETKGFVKEFETEVYKKNGEKVWISMNARAVNNGDGSILYYEGTAIDITERKKAETALTKSYEKLHDTLNATVIALAAAVEMRDPYTAGHQRRVAQLAFVIAEEMGLPQDQIEGIGVIGFLHDVGKINIPSEILSKPGKLNEYEFSLIQTHPCAGYDVVKGLSFPWPVAKAILQHHERLDGSGYPSHISGDAIIMEARILAVADVVEAMTSHRPYRPAKGMEEALEEISEKKDILYDPVVVEACSRAIIEKKFVFGEGRHAGIDGSLVEAVGDKPKDKGANVGEATETVRLLGARG